MRRLQQCCRFLRGERGQVLPLVVFAAVVLIGFAGLAIDLGRVWVAKQQLQRAVDAATLAAGQDLPNSATALSDAQAYAANGTRNPLSGWGATAGAPSITFECNKSGPDYAASGSASSCLTDSSGDNCHPSNSSGGSNPVLPAGATTCNEVRVTESATVTTGLLSLFIPSFTVTASSTAAARGTGLPKPMNVFVILDTTGSMDAGCSASVTGISSPDKLDCAKAGVQSLLQAMPYSSTSGAYDDVGVMVFPAISGTLTSGAGVPLTGSFSGTTTTNSASMTVSANESQYVGYTITGTGIPSGTTISASTSTKVTLSQKATSSGTHTFSVSEATTAYSLLPNATLTSPSVDETDCNQPSTSRTGTGYDNVSSSLVTYPPWGSYNTATIPSADLGNFSNYTGPNGYVDNYPGYQAVPLSSDYLSSSGVLNMTGSSNLVDSVSFAECKNQSYPGGDYYGIKDFVEWGVNGQHSYLAGAISEAQSVLAAQQAAQPTRTINGTAYPVTSGIIILSDGELNDPVSSTDGVDPGANGNVGWTSGTPCEDALNAATGAKAAGTLIFSIAYDDSGQACQDSGSTTGPSSLTSCAAPTSGSSAYSGSGAYYGSACSFMNYLSSGSSYFGDSSSSAGDLTSDFEQAASALSTGNSVLTPDCSAGEAPPNC